MISFCDTAIVLKMYLFIVLYDPFFNLKALLVEYLLWVSFFSILPTLLVVTVSQGSY